MVEQPVRLNKMMPVCGMSFYLRRRILSTAPAAAGPSVRFPGDPKPPMNIAGSPGDSPGFPSPIES